jgi:hypothetical protein
MICSVSSNLVSGTSVYAETAHERLAVGWRASIETALEVAHRLSL